MPAAPRFVNGQRSRQSPRHIVHACAHLSCDCVSHMHDKQCLQSSPDMLTSLKQVKDRCREVMNTAAVQRRDQQCHQQQRLQCCQQHSRQQTEPIRQSGQSFLNDCMQHAQYCNSPAHPPSSGRITHSRLHNRITDLKPGMSAQLV